MPIFGLFREVYLNYLFLFWYIDKNTYCPHKGKNITSPRVLQNHYLVMLALFFFTDYKCLCFHSRKSIWAESDFLCVILKLMTPPLCNSATRRASRSAVLHNFCSRERLTLCACLCVFTKIHECTIWPPVYSNIRSGCFTVHRLRSIKKSMNLNSLTAVSQCVMR